MIYSFGKDFIKNRQIEAEIINLNQQIYNLEKHNLELTELIKYFDSESYAERKARLELGLVKPGESTVIIPNSLAQNDILLPKAETEKNKSRLSNIKKWWEYFFDKNKNGSID